MCSYHELGDLLSEYGAALNGVATVRDLDADAMSRLLDEKTGKYADPDQEQSLPEHADEQGIAADEHVVIQDEQHQLSVSEHMRLNLFCQSE